MVAEEILPWGTGSGRQIRGRIRTLDPVPSVPSVPSVSSSPSVPAQHGGLHGGLHEGALSRSGRGLDDFEL